MAASSLGLGHETYAYPPPAASLGFPTDDDLMVAATMNFLPPADDCFPELGLHPTPDYYYYSPPPPLVFAGKNEINMRYGSGMMSRAAGDSGHRPSSPRIGFRTLSEVDVLDDGFKWRKYGKKAVKSSPNPRNYYRCSAEGCGVKKRVERDRHDRRYVVTTYDGVHNHAVPQPQAAATTTTLAAAAPPSVLTCGGYCSSYVLAAAAHSSESSY